MDDLENTPDPKRPLTARAAGLVICRHCSWTGPITTEVCPRCDGRLRSRDRRSLQKVWAYWITGLLCYIPANIYPMLETRTFLSNDDATIIGGAIDLMQHDAVGVAIIVLIASVLIPVGKFLAIAYLAMSVRRGSLISAGMRHKVYEVVEFIGRWSMIDVFVVAILSSLVQLSVVVSINPGPAALTFALSVIFTMLSAQSFDSRMIWDRDFEPGGAR